MMKRIVARALAGAALTTIGGASAAPLGKGHAGAAEAETVHLKYGISLLGLPIGSAAVNATIAAGKYKLDANAKLTGLAGVIVNSKGAATATGSIGSERMIPATFAACAGTGNYTLTIRMAMAKGAATGVEITPAYIVRPDRVPLSDADRRNIIDPLSAYVMSVPGTGEVIGPEACNRTLAMFDGGVRFDIVLAYAGTRQVKGAGYDGPVAICSARYRPIAGHRPDRPATKFMIDNKDMSVWLAPVGSTRHVIPYRVSVLTTVGTTVIEATDMQITADTKAAALPR